MYLLPINTQLLEPPVARLYEQVYSKCWEKLKDRPADQLFISEQSVEIAKKTLDNFNAK